MKAEPMSLIDSHWLDLIKVQDASFPEFPSLFFFKLFLPIFSFELIANEANPKSHLNKSNRSETACPHSPPPPIFIRLWGIKLLWMPCGLSLPRYLPSPSLSLSLPLYLYLSLIVYMLHTFSVLTMYNSYFCLTLHCVLQVIYHGCLWFVRAFQT